MGYTLCVVGLRLECYKLSLKDPTNEKIFLSIVEHRGDVAASDDLVGPLGHLESYMTTQIMKAVTTLSSSNAKNRSKGRGGAAYGH